MEHKETEHKPIRIMVRSAYDLQKLRIQMGNRIVGNFKVKLDQQPGESEDVIDHEGKEMLQILRLSYKAIADGVAKIPTMKKFKSHGIIDTYTEFCLVHQYISMEREEKEHFRRLEKILEEYPIYTTFLKGVKGIGPAMAGVILSEIDISKSQYASSIWKYAGLDVTDGVGRSRKAEHLVDVEYLAADGTLKTRKSITFNPFLKTKLIGVLGPSFIKQKEGNYRKIYLDYKHRLENMPAHEEKSKGHRNAMAVRYCVKRFLVDLYYNWRELEGLEVAREYSEAKLGIFHGKQEAA